MAAAPQLLTPDTVGAFVKQLLSAGDAASPVSTAGDLTAAEIEGGNLNYGTVGVTICCDRRWRIHVKIQAGGAGHTLRFPGD